MHPCKIFRGRAQGGRCRAGTGWRPVPRCGPPPQSSRFASSSAASFSRFSTDAWPGSSHEPPLVRDRPQPFSPECLRFGDQGSQRRRRRVRARNSRARSRQRVGRTASHGDFLQRRRRGHRKVILRLRSEPGFVESLQPGNQRVGLAERDQLPEEVLPGGQIVLRVDGRLEEFRPRAGTGRDARSWRPSAGAGWRAARASGAAMR